MELIKILETRQEKDGKWKRWAKFKCFFCLKIVEKRMCNGLISKFKKGKIISLITRQKMKKAQKGRIVSEKTREKMKDNHADFIGKNNPNWQGGISFEIYPQEFKQIKKFILGRDVFRCQFPNCTEIHDRLHVHHIDFNKKNNKPENLITLGTSCHSKTINKNNRQYWTIFYNNIIKEKYLWIF